MTYATRQDMIDLLGPDALSHLADRDGDFVADDAAISSALARASEEVEAYVATRYALPLTRATATLTQPTVDIAAYRLAVDGSRQTDDIRQRYEDAMRLLGRIASGKAQIVFAPDPAATEPERPQPVFTDGPARVFTRDKTRGL